MFELLSVKTIFAIEPFDFEHSVDAVFAGHLIVEQQGTYWLSTRLVVVRVADELTDPVDHSLSVREELSAVDQFRLVEI